MFGLIILMPYSDNKGRKNGVIVSWVLFTLGLGIIVTFYENLYIIYLGLFITGFSATPSINLI